VEKQGDKPVEKQTGKQTDKTTEKQTEKKTEKLTEKISEKNPNEKRDSEVKGIPLTISKEEGFPKEEILPENNSEKLLEDESHSRLLRRAVNIPNTTAVVKITTKKDENVTDIEIPQNSGKKIEIEDEDLKNPFDDDIPKKEENLKKEILKKEEIPKKEENLKKEIPKKEEITNREEFSIIVEPPPVTPKRGENLAGSQKTVLSIISAESSPRRNTNTPKKDDLQKKEEIPKT